MVKAKKLRKPRKIVLKQLTKAADWAEQQEKEANQW